MKVRIEPRQKPGRGQFILMVFVSVAFVFAALSLVFFSIGINPAKALIGMLTAPFQDGYYFSEALVRTTPLILTGLAVSVTMKMRLWNIGAEGQLFMGAFGAMLAARLVTGLPTVLMLILMMLGAIVCGGLFGGLVGFLKRILNVNETLTSLLLNYVATSWVNYLIYGPWRDPRNPGFPITTRLESNQMLPSFFGTRLHAGFIIAILTAILIWFVMEKTTFGYEIRATGESLEGARYAGIPINRNIVLIFVLAGALAAMAGFGELTGLHYKLQPGNVSNNYGSYGIIIAWLSGANPLVVILTAFIGGMLLLGAENLQITMGVAGENVQITIGVILILVLVSKFFLANRIVRVKQGKGGAAADD